MKQKTLAGPTMVRRKHADAEEEQTLEVGGVWPLNGRRKLLQSSDAGEVGIGSARKWPVQSNLSAPTRVVAGQFLGQLLWGKTTLEPNHDSRESASLMDRDKAGLCLQLLRGRYARL